MIKKVFLFFLPASLLLLGGCASHFPSLQGGKDQTVVIEALQTEIADLKHDLHATSVELRLLEDRIDSGQDVKIDAFEEEFKVLKRKVALFERSQEKTLSDLKQLSLQTHQAESLLLAQKSHLQDIEGRLEEVGKLRSLLSNLAKKETTTPSKEFSEKTYKVKPGDTLEKIARKYNTSSEHLKQINNLSSDKIIVGQTLQTGE